MSQAHGMLAGDETTREARGDGRCHDPGGPAGDTAHFRHGPTSQACVRRAVMTAAAGRVIVRVVHDGPHPRVVVFHPTDADGTVVEVARQSCDRSRAPSMLGCDLCREAVKKAIDEAVDAWRPHRPGRMVVDVDGSEVPWRDASACAGLGSMAQAGKPVDPTISIGRLSSGHLAVDAFVIAGTTSGWRITPARSAPLCDGPIGPDTPDVCADCLTDALESLRTTKVAVQAGSHLVRPGALPVAIGAVLSGAAPIVRPPVR